MISDNFETSDSKYHPAYHHHHHSHNHHHHHGQIMISNNNEIPTTTTNSTHLIQQQQPTATITTMLNRFVEPTTTTINEFETSGTNFTQLKPPSSSGCSRFQFVLVAATSPAVKCTEETLTYLNQGQSYELKLSYSNSDELLDHHTFHYNGDVKTTGASEENLSFLSVLRLCFWDRKLQEVEHDEIREVSRKVNNNNNNILSLLSNNLKSKFKSIYFCF